MTTQMWRRVAWCLFAVVVGLGAASCSDDSDDSSTDDEASTSIPEDSESTEPDGGSDTAPPSDGEPGSAGTVTIGDQSWDFDSRQCSVYAEDTVSIWGAAVDDHDVEITFDVFGVGEYDFSVFAGDVQWTANSDAITATVDGSTVSGTATVSSSVSTETEEATFEFHCA